MILARIAKRFCDTKTTPTEQSKWQETGDSPLVSGKLHASQKASFVLFTRINEHVCYFSIYLCMQGKCCRTI
jgi:hypothetical protein